jgi:hypothetical protein
MKSVAVSFAVASACLSMQSCSLGTADNRAAVSFDISSDEELVIFSDVHGAIATLEVKTGETKKLDLGPGVFTMVDLSNSNLELAVATRPDELSQHPQINVFELASGNKVLTHRVDGTLPCFSSDDRVLFFARAGRFSQPIGFGGIPWTEWDIWSFDRQTQEEKQWTNQKFLRISDIEYNHATKEVFFSADEASASPSPVAERIYSISKTGRAVSTTECSVSSISMCAAYPAFSSDGLKMVFVSDRLNAQHYSLFIRQPDSQIEKAQAPPCRFFVHPSFGKSTGFIYVLLAQTWDHTSRPELELWRLENAGVNYKVLTKEQFEGRE